MLLLHISHHRFSNQIPWRLFNNHVLNKMEQMLKPPEAVYLMKKINKTAFEKVIKVPVLSIGDVKVSTILPLVKKFILKLENFKPIHHSDEEHSCVYLNPEVIQTWADFPQDIITQLEEIKLTEKHFSMHDFTLQYENFNVETIFRAILPNDKEGMASFTKVGHIVHVNLREHLIPYKNIIGEVLFDKIKGCKSVVNKVNIIDNTYRNFQMEVLKGDNDMHTKLKENNCWFEFDFSSVYWNSRLSTEHERIVKSLKTGDVFFDIFAGVGPFSIPAAKQKCKVFANDLNPESYRWLMHNKKLNKISDENFSGFNLDGRNFILSVIREKLPQYISEDLKVVIVMNLPGLAVEFLSAFIGLLRDYNNYFKPITVHVYCFAKGQGPEEIARNLIRDNLAIKGINIDTKITDIFKVRTVSSMKEMMRVTLSLDRDVLVGVACDKRKGDHDNVELKKLRTKKMGKNKKKNNNVFKVAGAKSLKLKAKAKAVKSDLKNIKLKAKAKVVELDKALNGLEEKVRTSSEVKQTRKKKTTELPSTKPDEKTEQANKETTEKLATMQL